MIADRKGINMDFRGGGGDQMGCLDLKIPPFNEKTSYGLDRLGTNPEGRLPGGQPVLLL